VRGESEGKKRGGWPAEELRDWMRKQCPDPAEVASYIPVAEELGVALGGKSAGEEDSEKEKYDAANFARERGARRFIVPVPARAS
jgi:hypothetical protein